MLTPYDTSLPPDLRSLKEQIEDYARGYGLDFYETIFEVIDADDLNEIAAYGGFPTRYPHWSFGMAYEELKKGYDYGLSKIYEMVINNDPCYAYLMRCNHTLDQKLVMAHVYGHCLAPETKVETRRGTREIAQMSVGEEVLTHTGHYRPVRFCAKRPHRGKIYRIHVSGSNEPVRITGEHPVYVVRPASLGEPELVWVPASEIKVGDIVPLPRNQIPGSTMISVSIPEIALSAQHQNYCETSVAAVLSPPVQMPYPGGEPESAPSSWSDEHYLYQHVRAVEVEDFDGFVYNFSVEEDESYTLAAGMVVHNCDFFKNNAYFAHTNRKMMDEMANHGARIRRYTEKFGEDEVEEFIDRCMSIDDLIDIHSTAIRRRPDRSRYDFSPERDDSEELRATRFKAKDYMDDHINPRRLLQEEEEKRKQARQDAERQFPEQPEKDVLLFLIENAPLKNWQRDVLSIIRDEAYYFMPQAQTKIMNEGWACLTAGSLVYTSHGLMKIEEMVRHRYSGSVCDGTTLQTVYDWATFEKKEAIAVRTRRGFVVEGSVTHRLQQPNGSWKRLDELTVGDRVALSGGNDHWAADYAQVRYQRARRAAYAGMGSSREESRLSPMRALTVDESTGAFLGALLSNGSVDRTGGRITLSASSPEQAREHAEWIGDLFEVAPLIQTDGPMAGVNVAGADVEAILESLGLEREEADVPEVLLRSPRSVVVAFLRSYFTGNGTVAPSGISLVAESERLSITVQLLLLNLGILSTREAASRSQWQLRISGMAAGRFGQEIGFAEGRQQETLDRYLESLPRLKEEEWEDEIVAVEPKGRATVYDISVDESHCYAAQGFVNHNSYWHSTILTQKALLPSEVIDYADHHSGTMAMSGGRLNPYKLGIELLRDIEQRWNTGRFGKDYDECDDLDVKKNWNRDLGLGREKIFSVRKIYNDITFIDTFLTPEFCVEHNLFSFAYQEQAGVYYIDSRDFENIKQRLLFSLTNFGKPWIYAIDANYANRGELMLMHKYNGVELRLDHAADTLANIQFFWGRPVHLQTMVDDSPTVLTFDGQDHDIKTGGEIDDARGDDEE